MLCTGWRQCRPSARVFDLAPLLNPQLPGPFVSLKWKALVLTSLVLVGVTASYTGLNYLVLNQQFEKRRTDIQQDYARQVQGLLDQSSKRLQQIGVALASLPDVQRVLAQKPTPNLLKSFDELWSDLSIDIGMATLALFATPEMPIVARGWDQGDPRSDRLRRVVRRVIDEEQPHNLYYCIQNCVQFAVVPVLAGEGTAGALVLGVSLADVVLDFQRVSGIDMGLLADAAADTRPQLDDSRSLAAWRRRVVSVSNPDRNIPLLRLAASKFPMFSALEMPRYVDFRGRTFEVRVEPLAGSRGVGRAHLAAIADVTTAVTEIEETTRRNLLIGLAGLLVAETLLLAILWGPMSRLRRSAATLPLLAAAAFSKVREAIAPAHAKRWLRDEVDVLNGTALTLSSQLEQLHGELAARVEELKQERDFVTQVLQTAQVIILTQDDRRRILTANPYAEALSGYSHQELRGRRFQALVAAPDPRREDGLTEITAELRLHLEEESDLRCKDGSTLNIVWHHSRLATRAGDQPMILSVGIDITARKRAELKLSWLADHDPLTGLFNRRRLLEELEEAVARAKRYEHSGALMFLDLDQFKYVNDTSGHPAGDRLLETLGESLPALLREVDVIGRLGGDEFAVVLGQAGAEEATQVAKKVLAHIQGSEFRYGDRLHKVSASIGIALFPEHGSNAKDLLSYADLAMYQAKDSGRGRCHVYSEDDQSHRILHERVLWKEKVETALAERRFVLCVQPIVEVQTGITSHYEVLLRMRDSDGGLLSPATFIEVAERVGLIDAIDRLVLSEAIGWQAKLKRHGRRVTFAINLSGHAFNDTELLPYLKRLLYESGLDPKQVILEMTETAAVADVRNARRLMEAIRELGCSFALDDFGRGFSSFYYLRELPMEYVKIDGSFVRGLVERPDDQALVKAMGQIAKAFGKKTVAEHVESREVLALLRDFEIDYAQGYFTGKPVEVDAVFAEPGAA